MKKETATAIKIIAALSTVYIASNFYRSSISVIAPDVMDEIGLTHEQLGVVGGILDLLQKSAGFTRDLFCDSMM
ncbi:hypothetical protein [Sneathiella sp.]|uniref:hypothetical protein n=1 Tax=Sneathiella sp. TaxID=1964365 RepID=UPI003567CF04